MRTLPFWLWGLAMLAVGQPAGAFDLGSIFDTGTKTEVTSGQDAPDINQAQAEAYNGPKARVAVARFINKSGGAWYSREIGNGMADQLTTALFNSGRFIVLERQTLSDVLIEQDLGASGRVRSDTAAPIGQIEGAELLITGAVTEFDGNASGTRGGGGGLLGGVLGAVAGSVQKAHMAIDVRVIDAKTSRILAATSVEGSSTDVDLGAALGTYWGGGALGGALSSWENTPKEKALRQCIERAVEFIVSKTPPVYYRYGQGASRAAASAPAPTAARNVPRFAAGSVVTVQSARMNVRGGPGTGNPVVFSAAAGEPLTVQGQQGDWLEIRDAAGRSGWVAGWLVQAAPQAMPASAGSGGAAAKPGSAEERLRKLKDLHDKGLINDDEYAAKRDEVLQSL